MRLTAVPLVLVLYCALVDGARRRRYQDRVAREWLARKDEGRAATGAVDAEALREKSFYVTDDEGIDRPVVKLTDIDAAPTVCCGECANYR